MNLLLRRPYLELVLIIHGVKLLVNHPSSEIMPLRDKSQAPAHEETYTNCFLVLRERFIQQQNTKPVVLNRGDIPLSFRQISHVFHVRHMRENLLLNLCCIVIPFFKLTLIISQVLNDAPMPLRANYGIGLSYTS